MVYLSKIRFIDCLVYGPPCVFIMFINVFYINIRGTKICRCIMCVSIISRSCNCHFRMSNYLRILIFRITNGFFKNTFSFNRFFNLIILLICWFCYVLNITNGFFILSIRNGRSFYLLIHHSNTCRSVSIFLLDSSFYLSVKTAASTYSPIVLTYV